MNTEYVTPAVAGLFALLGAMIGAALSRRTEYEKWLRQARTEAFAVLVREVHVTREYATIAYYDEGESEPDKSMKITQSFVVLERHISLARLFMSSAGRLELTALVKKLWLSCDTKGGPANGGVQIKENMEKIQSLLEEELVYIPGKLKWPTVWFRG